MRIRCVTDGVVNALGEKMTVLVGAYVRSSGDEKDQSGKFTRISVSRQIVDCRRRATELGWAIVRTYEDNNLTAADEQVVRPAFEEMLKDLEGGVIEGVVCSHVDRLVRLETDAVRVMHLFHAHPQLVAAAGFGEMDLRTDDGRRVFMEHADVGAAEVAAVRRRVMRAQQDAAVEGRAHNGKRPFGWRRDNKTLDPFEAGLIRKAVVEVVRGKTIAAVRREWIAAGVRPTAEGRGPLRDKSVKDRILNPRICGYRVHLPAADRRRTTNFWSPDHVLYDGERPVQGEWEAIVTPEEWLAVVAVLEERRDKARAARVASGGYSRSHAKYLLSGIARCGDCGGPLYGKIDYEARRQGRDTFRYQCIAREGGCGRLKRVGPQLDQLVESAFLMTLKRGSLASDVAVGVDAGMEASERVTGIREEIQAVMARCKAGAPKRISVAMAMDLISDLERELAALTYERRKAAVLNAERLSESSVTLDEWSAYDVGAKRDRMRRGIRTVVVNRTGRGKRFDPSAVEIVWV
uniref:Recombinase family protein n=1 Tax=Streptomyces sp. NBC_01401 TaxID=2903854 RepID=A0AAU3GZW2_9ACTN